jgi:RHS repeat-associated protein
MDAAPKSVKTGRVGAAHSWWAASGLALLFATAPLQAQAATQTRISSWTYDAAGMIASETIEPDDAQFTLTTTYTYDAFGNKTAVTVSSPATGTAAIAPRTTSTTYTADGRFPATVTNALSQSETRVYHAAFGALTSQTGPNGLTTAWEYDSFGRKILETRPDGTKTKWEYLWCSGYNGGTLSGCPTLARYAIRTTPLASDGTTQIGARSLQYMDMLEREVRVETQGWASSAETAKAIYADTEYDAFGRVLKKSRPYYVGESPTWTTFEYDAIGRVIRENRPQEENGAPVVKQVNITYAALVTTVTNEWNEQRITTKNSQGQTIHVKNGRDDGSTSLWTVNQYTYDPFGNLMTVFDQDGNTVSFDYDKRGRKIGMSDPDKGVWSYEYDALGQLKSQTDAKQQVTEITYDLLGRTTSRVIKDATSAVQQTDSWVFDTATYGVGKLASATSTDGSSAVIHARTQAYDSLGRPAQTGLTQAGSTNYYTQSYDSLGRLSSLVYPSGLTLDYAYSDLSELVSVTNAATSTAIWTLDTRNAARQLTAETYGNTLKGTRQYEVGRGLLQFTETKTGTGTSLQRWDIGYDSVGNVTSRTESFSGITDTLQYDSLNRLISAATTGQTTLTMDYVGGNITYKSDVGTYTYPSAGPESVRPHAVSSIAGISGQPNRSYEYDANGNMTGGDGRSFVWNAFDMPVSITKGASTVSFAYDADHHRIRQVTPTEQKHYLTDTVTGARSERKLSLAGAHLRWDSYISVNGEMVSLVSLEAAVGETPETTTVRYFHRDHLGSTTMLTDASGTVVERLSYDVWGKRRYTSGAPDLSDSIVSQVDRGFTNHEHLEELALIHMNGRLYDATIARFVSADPFIADPLSTLAFNRYAYVDNNPCTYTDPTGYLSFKRIKNFFRSNPIASLIVGLAAAWATGGLSFTATGISMTWGGAVVAGAVSGALTGGIQGGILGGISGAVTFGIGQLDPNWVVGALMHGAAQGSLAAVQGGDFGSAFLGAALGSVGGSALQSAMPGKTFDVVLMKTVASAAVGGVASVVAGGKFQNGAATGAFIMLFNHLGPKLSEGAGQNVDISLGYTKVRGIDNANHALVIATDQLTGDAYATRAGPSLDVDKQAYSQHRGTGWGAIHAEYGTYDESFRDPPSRVHSVQKVGILNTSLADVATRMQAFADAVNASRFAYSPMFNNSNSYAFSVVRGLGFSPQPNIANVPLWQANLPGWQASLHPRRERDRD